jgi:apolipoprotein N-acyltransferase
LVFGLAFAASELLFPLLFPWYFGASVHQIPLLLQVAELGGPIAVGLVLVAANLAIAQLVIARLRRRSAPWRHALVLSSIVALAVAYGAVRIPSVDARVQAAPKATVGVVQANMSLLGKRRDRAEGLRRHLRLTEQVRSEGPVDLVVWSETSVTHAVDENAAATLLPRYYTRRLGGPAIVGAVLRRRVDDARRYVLFNSALVTNSAGDITGRYDKRYLLAFGEYLPLGEQLPILYEWSPNSGHFTPGRRIEPVVAADHLVAVLICYEDILPAYVNRIVGSGQVELLINMTNDAWFGDTTEPWIHLALSKLRAVEHRRFLVRSVNSGVSAFIDPAGRLVAHTQPFEQATLRSEIAWMSGRSPFLVVGQAPWWLASAIIVGMAFFRRPGARRAKAGRSARKPLRTATP